MTKLKIGSLFDGSGGFPLAATMCGIEPVWAAEVEPYPIAVTRSRFPNMKHLGSVTDINGAEIEPVDIITFGSPCQDLSVAGKRAGLKHEANGDDETTRSGLFMEAVRIIKEMREATNGRYPTFALWENVPGAFSSNKGEDFRTVCEELIKIVEPGAVMPAVPQKGWPYADSYCGDGWSLAYRVFDAQYWGVPQRRRRIHLILDLRGERAGKILFERDRLCRNYPESGEAWQATAGDASDCSGADDREGNCVAYSFDSLASNSMKSSNPHSGCRQVEVAKCLDTTDPNPSKNQGVIAIVEQKPVYCLQGNGIDRADTAGCNGKGWTEDVSYTLNTIDRPAVAYSINHQGGNVEQIIQEKTGTLTAAMNSSGNNKLSVAYLASGKKAVGTLMASMATKQCLGDQEAQSGDYHIIEEHNPPAVRYIVRRLTPTECARLQGFPDKHGHPDSKDSFTDEEYRFWLDVRNTHAEINGKAVKEYTKEQMLKWYNGLHTDSAEYKMYGNGIALPVAVYCMQGIVDALMEETDEEQR